MKDKAIDKYVKKNLDEHRCVMCGKICNIYVNHLINEIDGKFKLLCFDCAGWVVVQMKGIK